MIIKVVPQKYYLGVVIQQIDGDGRICMHWSGQKNSLDSIAPHLVQEHVIRCCRYKTATGAQCKFSLPVVSHQAAELICDQPAWSWTGRTLSKGHQWECWDPGLGPNVVRLAVLLSNKISI